METFRRDHRRPFYADERHEIHRIRPQAPQYHPRDRFVTHDAPYLEEIPIGPIRPRRRMPMPQFYEEETTYADNNRSYQSSEPDLGPKPLLPPETIEKLRANLNMINQTLNRYEKQNREQYEKRDRYEVRYRDRFDDRYQDRYDVRYEDQYDDHYEDQAEELCEPVPYRHEPRPGHSSVRKEELDPNEYLQEEEVTKKTIEEIIMVAQALREKLEHRQEEEQQIPEYQTPAIEFYEEGCEPIHKGRRPPLLKTPNIKPIPFAKIAKTSTTSTKIPSLLEIKPKIKSIPSLLTLQVEPPEVEYVQENVIPYNRETRSRDLCWNCNKIGHRHEVCWFPSKEFCYRCGTQGVNEETCPNCLE